MNEDYYLAVHRSRIRLPIKSYRTKESGPRRPGHGDWHSLMTDLKDPRFVHLGVLTFTRLRKVTTK